MIFGCEVELWPEKGDTGAYGTAQPSDRAALEVLYSHTDVNQVTSTGYGASDRFLELQECIGDLIIQSYNDSYNSDQGFLTSQAEKCFNLSICSFRRLAMPSFV